jgi:hypothetical protein
VLRLLLLSIVMQMLLLPMAAQHQQQTVSWTRVLMELASSSRAATALRCGGRWSACVGSVLWPPPPPQQQQ